MSAREPGGEPRARLHWLVLGVLVSVAAWGVVAAVVVAALGSWTTAGTVLGAAVALGAVTYLLARPRRARVTSADAADSPAVPGRAGGHARHVPEQAGAPATERSSDVTQR